MSVDHRVVRLPDNRCFLLYDDNFACKDKKNVDFLELLVIVILIDA